VKFLRYVTFVGSDHGPEEENLRSTNSSDIKTTESANSDLTSTDQYYPQKSYSWSSDDSSSENENMMFYNEWSNLSMVKKWLNIVKLKRYGNSWYFHPSPPSDVFDDIVPKGLALKYAKQLITEQVEKYGVKNQYDNIRQNQKNVTLRQNSCHISKSSFQPIPSSCGIV